MSTTDPFTMFLTNPNANTEDEDTSAVVYYVSTTDNNPNELDLTITNSYGATVTFSPQSPINVSMKAVLPSDVITNMQVKGIPDGWTWSVHSGHGSAQGIDLTPTSTVTLDDQKSLNFTFVSIVFTKAEVQDGTTVLGDFDVSYSITVPDSNDPLTGDTPLKVLVTQPVTQSRLFTHFEATVIEVDQKLYNWNVQVKDEQIWLDKGVKDINAVYTNAINNVPIKTRLAFRLTNQDMQFPLTLNSQSAFKVQFLPGDGCNQLANSQDLQNNITISEVSTHDWIISPPTGDGALEWTLTPKGDISMAKQGGYYDFLIDAVLPNGNPSDPNAKPAGTEMYILYTKVPLRNDTTKFYDDGYLAVDLEKVVPSQDMALVGMSFKFGGIANSGTLSPSDYRAKFTISPQSFTLHANNQVTMNGYVTSDRVSIEFPNWTATGSWTLTTKGEFDLVLNLTDNTFVLWKHGSKDQDDGLYTWYRYSLSGSITIKLNANITGLDPSTLNQTNNASAYCEYASSQGGAWSKLADCFVPVGDSTSNDQWNAIWNKSV